jgi:hypothetical protein
MSDRPRPEDLAELGESTTNVANAWAGANEYLSRGLVEWTRRQITDNRAHAVRAALAACELVAPQFPNEPVEGLAPKKYVDDMIAAIKRWLADPSKENTQTVRSSLDVTREAHAWQRDQDVAPYWIVEAVDHTCLAVWSGERASYIVPMDFATCGARAVACVLHTLIDMGETSHRAAERVVDVVQKTR